MAHGVYNIDTATLTALTMHSPSPMTPLIKLFARLSFVVVAIQASPLQYEVHADGVASSATLDGVTYLNKVS